MANALYENYVNLMQGAGTHTRNDLDGNALLRMFLREEGTSGAPNTSTDIDAADVSGGAIECDSALTNVVAGANGPAYGSFDHDLVTWSTVAASVTYESLDYFDDTSASDATAPLICNIDTATGLSPVTSNGGDITWDPNAAGVFQQTVT
jgi:hypothetical protein